MQYASVLSLVAIVVILSGCGKDNDEGQKSTTRAPAIEEQVSQGSYRALLRPLNSRLSGFIPTGVAEISISGDVMEVKTLLDDDARVAHRQAIQLGTRCPTLSDDGNGDGVIDIAEALRASGAVFIPLDSDLNSAELGAGVYPIGSGFTYTEKASLQELEADARERTGQNLNLAGRVVLIHGVASETALPETVATVENQPRSVTIPVACGILKRLN